MSKKKILTSVVAVGTAAALALGGTFAWQSISQTALNESSDIVNPGGRLHNDLSYVDATTNNSDVFVENFSDDALFARVRLEEYMEIVMNYGVEGAEVVETVAGSKTPVEEGDLTAADATQQNQFTYTYSTHYFDQANNTDDFWTWHTGDAESGAVYYMPTFNKNKDSLAADLNGLYNQTLGGISNRDQAQYEGYTAWAEGQTNTANAIYDGDPNSADELNGLSAAQLNDIIANGADSAAYDAAFDSAVTLVSEEHTTAQVGSSNGLISMEEWLLKSENDEELGNYWVYDEDGWVYWSSPIGAGETTGLLLDGFSLNHVMDNTWYYAVNVVGQFVTADDVGKTDNTGFYDTTAGPAPSAAAETLLTIIGVDMSGESADQPGNNEGAIDSMNVFVDSSRNWYSEDYETTDDITLTASAKWYTYSPWQSGDVDDEAMADIQWSLSGNTNADTKLSATTGKEVTLTLGAGENGELTVSATLIYQGVTETGSETIYAEPHVGSFNLYTMDNQHLSATTQYEDNSSTTYQLLLFPKYLGELSKYDPDEAFTGAIQQHFVEDLTFAIATDDDAQQETTIEGVTLVQDTENKAKVTLNIAEGVTENFRIVYKFSSGQSYSAFAPIPFFNSFTNASAAENKVTVPAGQSTEFKLDGKFEYYDVSLTMTGHKANGEELAEVVTFEADMDYDDPTKVTVRHTCADGACTCDAELAYCTLTATVDDSDTTITSDVKIYNKAAEAETLQTLQLSSTAANMVEIASDEAFKLTAPSSTTVAADQLTVTAVKNGASVTLAKDTDYTYENGKLTITNSDLHNAFVCVADNAGNKGYVRAAKGGDTLFLLHTGEDNYYEMASAAVNGAASVQTQTYSTPVVSDDAQFEIKTADGLGDATLSGSDYTYSDGNLTITNSDYAGRLLLVTFNGQGGYIYVKAA